MFLSGTVYIKQVILIFLRAIKWICFSELSPAVAVVAAGSKVY